MSKLIYQASSLRAMVKQMLPGTESKNISDSNFCVLSIMQRRVPGSNVEDEVQHLLYAETQQPTFCIGLGMVLTTNDVESDDELALKVLTRDLDCALASFGQRMVCLRLLETGIVELSSATVDEDGLQSAPEPVRMVRMRGELDTPLVLPDAMKIADISTMQAGDDMAILQDKTWLLEGLRTAVDIASTRGNGLKMQGVELRISPEALHIEGNSISIFARSHYKQPWAQCPRQSHLCKLSPDCVRHLLSTLSTYGDDLELTMTMSHCDLDDTAQLTIQCDTVTVICDC